MSSRGPALLCKAAILTALGILFLPANAPAQDFDRKAREIVQKMTLDEKIQELHGIHTEEHYRYVPGVPRLGIGAFQITNGPAGAGPGGTRPPQPQPKATALPSPIGVAASWDPQTAYEYGAIAGAEAKDIGNALLEAPTINIARVPQNGRTFEGYGEDPYLTGRLSVANIQGIQSQRVMANVKHYAANNQEADRFIINEEIDERALREIYLPAFEESVRQGNSASVMCSYPRVNGTFSCENTLLLDDILKKEWNYKGFVLSDFGAVHSTIPAALSGLDLEMPTGKYWGDDLKKAIESGQVPMSAIDDKLVRRFRVMMEYGVFNGPPEPKPVPEKEDGAESRKIAEQGMVLLKNAGSLLPLKAASLKSIALIGPMATKAVTGGGGSSHVVPLYTVNPLDGIRRQAGSANVVLNDGSDAAQAAALARASDVAIVMAGEIDTEGKDHPIELGGNQNELIEAVAEVNPRTIVVLKTGSAMLMPWMEKVPAVLEAWYPGEEDGNAVADILFGAANPSGKLPITFPARLQDVPANTPEQYPGVDGVARYSEGIFVGYRHYDEKKIVPLFPFGHGLSYTTFAYGGLRVSPENAAISGNRQPKISVELEIRNTGRVAGAEVAQLYVGMPLNAVPQPPKQLKAFQKVFIALGKSARVRFQLDGSAFSYWDVKTHAWRIAPGEYKLMVGSSSRDIRLERTIRLRDEAAAPQ